MQRETCLLSAAAKRSPVETAKCQTSHGMIIKCETQLWNRNDAVELRRDIFRRCTPERAIKGQKHRRQGTYCIWYCSQYHYNIVKYSFKWTKFSQKKVECDWKLQIRYSDDRRVRLFSHLMLPRSRVDSDAQFLVLFEQLLSLYVCVTR